MPLRVGPELEYLQVKWAAHLPYAVATTLLKEILPVDQTISTSGLRNRVWAVGQELDDHAESAIRGERDYPPADSHVKIAALAGERNNPGAGVINAFSGQQFLQGNSVLSSTAIDFDGPLLN